MSVCVNCGKPLVIIDLTVGETPTRMSSCSACGRRTWSTGNHEATLDEVLTAASRGASQRPERTPPPVA